MIYIVQKKDTLKKIARAHSMSLTELIALNPQVADPDAIYPGEILILEAPAPEYVVDSAADF